jgi:hypothetical protein
MSVIIKAFGGNVEIFREGNASKGIEPKMYRPKNKAEISSTVMELRRCGYTIREGRINEVIRKGMAMIKVN